MGPVSSSNPNTLMKQEFGKDFLCPITINETPAFSFVSVAINDAQMEIGQINISSLRYRTDIYLQENR